MIERNQQQPSPPIIKIIIIIRSGNGQMTDLLAGHKVHTIITYHVVLDRKKLQEVIKKVYLPPLLIKRNPFFRVQFDLRLQK